MIKVSKFKMFLARLRRWIFILISGVWNLITDLFVPVISVLAVVALIIPGVPLKWVAGIKWLEELLKHLGSSKEQIDAEIDKYKNPY